LAKSVNLDNPEDVEDFILDLDKKNKYETNLSIDGFIFPVNN